jgi:Holliday junction resolvase RusA-like endonuclease
LKYEFPWPPRSLSPNVSVHWRTLAKAKAGYKEACGWVVLVQKLMAYKMPHERVWLFKPPVTAQVTFVCDARRRDPDNHMAMLKPLWDALVEMGVLEDDSHDKLKIAAPKWERGEKKVIVELSPYRNGGRA